jgi:hypothetical protein
MSKIFERLLLKRIEETMPLNKLIPNHQFGFRTKHSTIQQCHRIINKIKTSFEGKQYCSSVFLDVQLAFDKVWHENQLIKDLFTQTLEERRLKRIWSENLLDEV